MDEESEIKEYIRQRLKQARREIMEERRSLVFDYFPREWHWQRGVNAPDVGPFRSAQASQCGGGRRLH